VICKCAHTVSNLQKRTYGSDVHKIVISKCGLANVTRKCGHKVAIRKFKRKVVIYNHIVIDYGNLNANKNKFGN
jgi:hypothetical protein